MGIPSRSLVVHEDERGSVREAWRASWFSLVPPVAQVVHSESNPGVMRAMHHHKKQYDIWHFVSGTAYVQTYDPDSANGGPHGGWYGPTDSIVIPPGVAHGFYTPKGCILAYLLTLEWDGTDEYEFDALDPKYPGAELWPTGPYIRSKRDLNAQSFEKWLADR